MLRKLFLLNISLLNISTKSYEAKYLTTTTTAASEGGGGLSRSMAKILMFHTCGSALKKRYEQELKLFWSK